MKSGIRGSVLLGSSLTACVAELKTSFSEQVQVFSAEVFSARIIGPPIPVVSKFQVARDILGLTKLNYNSYQLGERQPVTVKYSDRVGEILLANSGLSPDKWKHNFRYYVFSC